VECTAGLRASARATARTDRLNNPSTGQSGSFDLPIFSWLMFALPYRLGKLRTRQPHKFRSRFLKELQTA